MKEESQILNSLPFVYSLNSHRLARGNQVAIIDGQTGHTVTYGSLSDRVSRIAGWLTEHGISHGDRLACLALNSKEYLELLLAMAWIGAVAIPLNVRLNPKELEFIIKDSGAKALFSCGVMAEVAERVISNTPEVQLKILNSAPRDSWVSFDELTASENKISAIQDNVSGETLFMLLYTSGTTGKPKGCMIPQRSWTGYAVNMASCFKMDSQDIYLAFLPFFHVAGLGTAFSQLILGGTVVTAGMPDPKLFYTLIEKYRVSIMFLVPGISAAFLYDEARAKADLSSLRIFISGAGLEKVSLIEDVEKYLGAEYYGIYGQTESGSKITWANAEMIKKDPSTYGYVMPFIDYRILDSDDKELPPGKIGELCIRGQSVMQGYWGRQEDTAETLKNNWHHTGDLFMKLDNGLVKMVDRKKYLIKTGGENVYPQEVEQVLLKNEAIKDAAVIGIPDDQWGETVKAFIVVNEGMELSRQEISAWVGDSIASYKKPRYIEFVEMIPRNVSGKILKNELAGRETSVDQKV